MPRCRPVVLASVLAACAAPETEPPVPVIAPSIEELIGEAEGDLSNDVCILGCAGAALEGCEPVRARCDGAFVISYGSSFITCEEANQAACGGTLGAYACVVGCRARAGRRG